MSPVSFESAEETAAASPASEFASPTLNKKAQTHARMTAIGMVRFIE
jgi:hypothetical protein